MAYRRRQVPEDDFFDEALSSSSSSSKPYSSSSNSNSSSLAAKAMRASSSAATRRESSLSSAYGPRPVPPPSAAQQPHLKDCKPAEYISFNESNSKQGFWGSLARKAKSFIDDDYDAPPQVQTTTTPAEYPSPYNLNESTRKTKGSSLNKGLGRITSSISYIGNAMEEGLTKVENRTAGIIQETRKHIKKKPNSYQPQKQDTNKQTKIESQAQPLTQTDLELQLKASRDVAMAMAAKAKILLRELKTVKADFAFAKERCAQLEEENKILRENRERGERPEDDDLIRLQLETLLAEKARLAHENSVYARENRFLREVVEYHQLTMQDVVYLDEGTEEVTEVYPIKVVSDSQPASTLLTPNPSLHPFRGLHQHEFPSESE